MEQLLIIEDDIGLNQGLSKALKADDRQIISCHELKAAREQLLCGSVSLILLDINLPDGSGLELLREVKENTPYIPVILLTANDTDLDIVDGLERGADDYIMVMGDTRIEALDNSLFDKLQVFDGDISPMLEPDNNAIAIAVSLDDYGNLPNLEYYPKVGDTITATYADDVKYIDSRTGELRTEDTPEEYFQAKLYGARDVEYTVCALVELPYSMGYRYRRIHFQESGAFYNPVSAGRPLSD